MTLLLLWLKLTLKSQNCLIVLTNNTDKEDEANIRLRTAAPALLAALKGLFNQLNNIPIGGSLVYDEELANAQDEAFKAIAKTKP